MNGKTVKKLRKRAVAEYIHLKRSGQLTNPRITVKNFFKNVKRLYNRREIKLV